MKHYLLTVAVAFALCLLATLGLVALASGYPPSLTANIYRAKLDRAHEVPSPKIVLIGGSNVSYGFRAEMLERHFGIPAINLAQNAGSGADYLLFLSRQALNPGDIVILAFEYEFYDNHQVVNASNSSLALWNSLAWVREQPIGQMVLWARNITFGDLLNALRTRLKGQRYALPSQTINNWGDFIANAVPDAQSRRRIDALAAERPTLFKFDRSSATAQAIIQFSEWCHRNGVRPMAAWPTFDDALIEPDNFAQLSRQLETFFAESRIAVIGSARDSLLPRSLLFDTPHHPNKQGAELRTRQIITGLESLRVTH